MGGWVDGWMGGWVDGWMGGWVDGWMGGCFLTALGNSEAFQAGLTVFPETESLQSELFKLRCTPTN